MRRTTFPASIPVVDLVSEFTPYRDAEDKARWLACHRQFVAAAPNREGIVAYGSGHYIFQENPPLVVESIVKIYTTVLGQPNRPKSWNAAWPTQWRRPMKAVVARWHPETRENDS
jgi:hypothetical protein